MKLTDYNLRENRQNHAKDRNFFENKYLILCVLCDLCGFVKFGFIQPGNLRKIMTKLCKTNPNSKMPKLTHTLFYKELMKNYRLIRVEKTNPKRTQTKPNSERVKMITTSFSKRDYENKLLFRPQKNEAKTNPNSKSAKMAITSVTTKDYENVPTWRPKKTKPKQTQFPTCFYHFLQFLGIYTGTVALTNKISV